MTTLTTPPLSDPTTTRTAPHILLAEDDEAMRQLLAHILRAEGFDVTECADGLDVLYHLTRWDCWHKPDYWSLIVSDVRMPHFDGFDVLRDAHQEGYPRVLLMTAFGDAELHTEAHRLAAVDVLDKPFELATFVAAVREALQLDADAEV